MIVDSSAHYTSGNYSHQNDKNHYSVINSSHLQIKVFRKRLKAQNVWIEDSRQQISANVMRTNVPSPSMLLCTSKIRFWLSSVLLSMSMLNEVIDAHA